MSEKLELRDKLQAVDQNFRELWDELDEVQQKDLKNDFFILNRYISSVGRPKTGNMRAPTRKEQEHYVLAVNEYYNKHFYSLQKHPKLLWLLLCMCSYDGETKYFHEWIGNKKISSSTNKRIKFLEEFYPHMKSDELEMLAKISTDAELKELGQQYGLEDAEIKKRLK